MILFQFLLVCVPLSDAIINADDIIMTMMNK